MVKVTSFKALILIFAKAKLLPYLAEMEQAKPALFAPLHAQLNLK
jgi:hypothetical protein